MSNELTIDPSSGRHCVHTKNIFSLIDMTAQDEAFHHLSKHLSTCSICARELKKFQMKSQASLIHIPKVSMDRELKQTFDSEVGELFKILLLDQREILKLKVKNKFKSLDQMGIDFINILTSKAMIKMYLFAGGLYFLLRHFFN